VAGARRAAIEKDQEDQAERESHTATLVPLPAKCPGRFKACQREQFSQIRSLRKDVVGVAIEGLCGPVGRKNAVL